MIILFDFIPWSIDRIDGVVNLNMADSRAFDGMLDTPSSKVQKS
jgi:hypothetical protein